MKQRHVHRSANEPKVIAVAVPLTERADILILASVALLSLSTILSLWV